MSSTINIFIAYSRKDAEYSDELRTHFTPLERSRKVTIWFDGKIEPGALWETAIKKRLHSVDIILLLVSASAIASDYFCEEEMKDALERHRLGTTKVVPFILRPCTWQATPLAKLQVIPKDGKPVSTWNDRDEAYSDAINRLREMVNNMDFSRLEESEAKQKAKEELRINEEAEARRKTEEELRAKEEALVWLWTMIYPSSLKQYLPPY